MDEHMSLIQAALLAKPAKPSLLVRAVRALAAKLKPLLPVHKNDVIVMRGCALALVLFGLLAVTGQLHAEPTDAEKQAAHKQCRQELGPLGVPLWTADGQVICRRITLVLR